MNASATGLFISFEGIDGAGKSSHIDSLANAFRDRGRTVCLTREPGGTPLAEALRELVLHRPMDPLTEALIIFAGRRDHLRQVIRPALARGEVVLCDRFTDASFAYQGAGRGVDLGLLRTLERWVQGDADAACDADAKGPGGREGEEGALLEPDLTLWFDLSPEIAAVRLAAARVPDRFESQPQAFFSRVAAGYAARAAAAPRRFARIDASADLAGVARQVAAELTRRGWLPPQEKDAP